MKVLLINGSPHRDGCVDTALKEVELTLNKNGIESEIFWIGNQAVQGCAACWKCRENGADGCIFKDDLYTSLVEKNQIRRRHRSRFTGLLCRSGRCFLRHPRPRILLRRQISHRQSRCLCRQLPPRRCQCRIRPSEQILHHFADAGCFQHLLEQHPRVDTGGNKTR